MPFVALPIMPLDKCRNVMKMFIEYHFIYCFPVWMLHSKNISDKIKRLHKWAWRVVYFDNTSTIWGLLDKSFLDPYAIQTQENFIPEIPRQLNIMELKRYRIWHLKLK